VSHLYSTHARSTKYFTRGKNLAYNSPVADSNASKSLDAHGNEVITDRNLDYIRKYVSGADVWGGGNFSDIIDATLNTENVGDRWGVITQKDKGSFVLVIQLCLTTIALHPKYCKKPVSRFDESQAEVYASPTQVDMFIGRWKENVNLRWVLHAINFFRFHLKAGNGEGLFTHAYEQLASYELPQPWLGKLKAGTREIGNHWKGIYRKGQTSRYDQGAALTI